MIQNDIWDLLDSGLDAVDRAVSSRDFRHLERTIRQAMAYGGETVRRASERKPFAQPGSQEPQYTPPRPVRCLYGSSGGKMTAGILKAVFGGIISITCTSILGVFSFLPGVSVAMIPGCAMGGVLIGVGVMDIALCKRYKSYRRILGEKTTAPLQALAGAVGKSARFVRKDLQKMFGEGLFLEGHLDHEGTTLITSHDTFRQFEQSRLLMEQRRKEAPEPARPNPAQEVLDKGNAFVRELRRCNDRIPGEVVSGKISRMELIVQKIFDRARTNPEIIPDLKKLLDYYLPMTVKLLNAYADMDEQPIQGETILASKKEIEGTLDTLNLAFEKLLDQVFQDAALDVSSDITVLQTMLAQEGLTEDELTKMRKGNT